MISSKIVIYSWMNQVTVFMNWSFGHWILQKQNTATLCVTQDFNSSVVDLFGSIFVGGAI